MTKAYGMGAGDRPAGRACLLAALALLCPLLLSSCGWHPLYERPSPDPASGGVATKLAAIAIDPIESGRGPDPLRGSPKYVYDSRTAQLLQDHLKNDFNPYGGPKEPAYRLSISLTEVTRGSSQLGNGQATREDVVLTALYQLLDQKGNLLLDDKAQSVTSYDVLNQPFNDIAAQRDAMQRGAEQLAQTIETRVAVFLQP